MFTSANPTLLEILQVGGRLELPDGSGITLHMGEFGDRIAVWGWSSPLRQEFEVSAAGLEEALRTLDHVRFEGEISVRIRWGSASTQHDMYELQGNDPASYSFATRAELEAFLRGVDEASGWMDYIVVEEEEEEEPCPAPAPPSP